MKNLKIYPQLGQFHLIFSSRNMLNYRPSFLNGNSYYIDVKILLGEGLQLKLALKL